MKGRVKSMYPITSRFKDFEHFRKTPHKGIDFAMEKSTPLRAIVDGKIQVIDYGNLKAGKTVVIKGSDGMTYIYGHLSEFKVRDGEIVKQGDLIGMSGNSGNVYGSGGGYHLDFTVKNEQGQFIDPAPYSEFIQNMNDPKYIKSLTDTVRNATEVNLDNVMQQFSDGLSNINFNFFNEGTANMISMLLRILT